MTWIRASVFVMAAVLAGMGVGPAVQAAELIAAKGTDVSSFDPGINPTLDAQQAVAMIYDTLIQRDDTMQLRPGLALSWQTIDPQTWQLKLRRGVTFHNGEPFDGSVLRFVPPFYTTRAELDRAGEILDAGIGAALDELARSR